jgi:HSP20 family protein
MASTGRHEVARRTPDMFGRFLGPWPEWFHRPAPWWPFEGEDMLRVDEVQEGDTLVVRAEMGGIDPDKDVEITVEDGMLHLRAERRQEEEKEGKSWRRRELRYGSFTRDIPLPEGASEKDVKATYKDGILEVRVPMPAAETKKEARRVPVTQG